MHHHAWVWMEVQFYHASDRLARFSNSGDLSVTIIMIVSITIIMIMTVTIIMIIIMIVSITMIMTVTMSRYVHGFGDPASEFWLGLDKLKQLTR